MFDLPRKPRHGDLFEVDIDHLELDGMGVATLDTLIGPQRLARSYSVHVRRALPGDRVRVRVERVRRQEIEGAIDALLSAAPMRGEPRCRHFGQRETPGKGCGGCTLQPLPYEHQLAAKREMVVRALGAASAGVTVAPVIGSEPWFYRNKMELSFGDDRARRFALGLHPWGYRHEVFALEACYLMSDALAPLAAAASAWAGDHGLAPYRHRDDSGFLRTLTVREGKRSGDRLVALTTSAADEVETSRGRRATREVAQSFGDAIVAAAAAQGIALTSAVWTQQDTRRGEPTSFVDHVLSGAGSLTERLELPSGQSLSFEIHARAFFQPNTLGAERLYAQVLAAAAPGKRVLDLYCGTGTIGLCLAASGGEVTGVELSEVAVANAARNAARNGLSNRARFIAGDVAKVLRAQPEIAASADVVVVDPPRSGLTPRALELVAGIAARRIVYVSCNPSALGRDLAALAPRYVPRSIQPVDMFPQTAHVETVVALDRCSLL